MSAACTLCGPFAPGHPAGDVLFESAGATVILAADWSARGHAIVVAKRHVENVSSLSPDESRAFFETYRDAETILLQETGADRAIVMKLGLAVPHLHVHIYPVSRSLDRAQVFDILENRRQSAEPRDRELFVAQLRQRFVERR
jgi:diadenosine tetraphosphate (Ap4A) HIT family hydrolase